MDDTLPPASAADQVRPANATGTRAAQAVVVSVRKSGTHLIREVVAGLGYTPYGAVAGTARGHPPLGRATTWRILQVVYTPAELEALAACDQQEVAERAVREAVAAYLQAWWIRLGVRQQTMSVADQPPPELVARALTSPAARNFADTPDGVCWFVHQLDLERVDQAFLQPWADTGRPPVLYLYRDPRDVLLSMVNYLTNHEPSRLGTFTEHHIYASIMQSVPTLEERLTIALRDPCFPGTDAFARGLWLLRHPHVCAVSFEELVGPRGGGSAQAQTAAVTRIAEFLGVDADPAAVAATVFNPDSATFHQGRIGAWREHFTPAHLRLFNERHAAVAGQYGYTH